MVKNLIQKFVAVFRADIGIDSFIICWTGKTFDHEMPLEEK